VSDAVLIPGEGLSWQQALLVRPGSELRPGAKAQLGEHVVDVHLDRPDRQDKPVGDVPIGQPAGYQRGDFGLASGQLVPRA
jgi:hypothetical protein